MYDGETKGHKRDMGTPSKKVLSAGTNVQITCNKKTIQPNNKTPELFYLTILYGKRLHWKKNGKFLYTPWLVVVSVSSLDVRSSGRLCSAQA